MIDKIYKVLDLTDTIRFGKYKNTKVVDIIDNDRNYFSWLKNTANVKFADEVIDYYNGKPLCLVVNEQTRGKRSVNVISTVSQIKTHFPSNLLEQENITKEEISSRYNNGDSIRLETKGYCTWVNNKHHDQEEFNSLLDHFYPTK